MTYETSDESHVLSDELYILSDEPIILSDDSNVLSSEGDVSDEAFFHMREVTCSETLLYDGMDDEKIVGLIAAGDRDAQEYLVYKYKNFVKAKARSYFLIGADKEDIIQEGMIGLFKATRDFKAGKQSSFRAFAELCITRQIITAVKTATRQKHIPLNSYVSLNKPIFDEDSDRTLLDTISGTRITDPEELIIGKEEFNDIEDKMGEALSALERQVLMAYLDGKSYQEMAQVLKRHVKSIDNALQRVKRKFERYLQSRNQQNNR